MRVVVAFSLILAVFTIKSVFGEECATCTVKKQIALDDETTKKDLINLLIRGKQGADDKRKIKCLKLDDGRKICAEYKGGLKPTLKNENGTNCVSVGGHGEICFKDDEQKHGHGHSRYKRKTKNKGDMKCYKLDKGINICIKFAGGYYRRKRRQAGNKGNMKCLNFGKDGKVCVEIVGGGGQPTGGGGKGVAVAKPPGGKGGKVGDPERGKGSEVGDPERGKGSEVGDPEGGKGSEVGDPVRGKGSEVGDPERGKGSEVGGPERGQGGEVGDSVKEKNFKDKNQGRGKGGRGKKKKRGRRKHKKRKESNEQLNQRNKPELPPCDSSGNDRQIGAIDGSKEDEVSKRNEQDGESKDKDGCLTDWRGKEKQRRSGNKE